MVTREKWWEHHDPGAKVSGIKGRTSRSGMTMCDKCLRGAVGVKEEERVGSGKR